MVPGFPWANDLHTRSSGQRAAKHLPCPGTEQDLKAQVPVATLGLRDTVGLSKPEARKYRQEANTVKNSVEWEIWQRAIHADLREQGSSRGTEKVTQTSQHASTPVWHETKQMQRDRSDFVCQESILPSWIGEVTILDHL